MIFLNQIHKVFEDLIMLWYLQRFSSILFVCFLLLLLLLFGCFCFCFYFIDSIFFSLFHSDSSTTKKAIRLFCVILTILFSLLILLLTSAYFFSLLLNFFGTSFYILLSQNESSASYHINLNLSVISFKSNWFDLKKCWLHSETCICWKMAICQKQYFLDVFTW